MQLMTDSNVVVTVEAMTAAGHLAKGLRKGYIAGSRNLLTTLLVRSSLSYQKSIAWRAPSEQGIAFLGDAFCCF